MSIAPPSDIVLDVAQAADPLKLQAATTKLAQAARAEAGGAAGFDSVLTAAAGPAVGRAVFTPVPFSTHAGPAYLAGKPGEMPRTTADRKFEALVLQNFIENILPKNAELFGDAASADMGRSLMAEQIANQLAKSGRIGIARSLDRAAANAAAAAPVAPAGAPSVDTLPATSKTPQG